MKQAKFALDDLYTKTQRSGSRGKEVAISLAILAVLAISGFVFFYGHMVAAVFGFGLATGLLLGYGFGVWIQAAHTMKFMVAHMARK